MAKIRTFKRTCHLILSRHTKKKAVRNVTYFYGKYKMGKTNKKNYFVNIIIPMFFFSKTLRTFILANTDKILENSEN